MGILESFSLAGRAALVTGAGRGIGRGIALALAEAGGDVALVSRTEADLVAVAAEIEDLGRRAVIARGDVSTAAGARAVVERAIAGLGQLDVLANVAGVVVRAPAEEVTEAQYDQVMDVNLRGTFFASQVAGRHMLGRGRGSIINIGSVATSIGLARRSVYSAAKGGIAQLTKTLAIEWAARGVRVNAISPGWILTPLTQRLHDDPEQSAWIVNRTPAGRWGVPRDLAGAAVFLASDAAGFVTGQVLHVDGGFIVA
jgi:2-deoxy-D-gluconate 3-dehydrogenase